MLLLHGPVFWAWSLLPLTLYVGERVMQIYRGKKPFKLVKVEWIKPVLAVYFRPVYKADFQFKEGQYLYLGCPFINPAEWHPFTISSAADDLRTGELISLATGEPVVEVPRPAGVPHDAKWQKYCPASVDYRKLRPEDMLEKHEVSYNDYVSVHIKVSLSNPNSWTRKLKDYIELLHPGGSFPYYFTQRNERGDVEVGRLLGPDGQQVITVDGPHSAPSEHYNEYGTVMVVGKPYPKPRPKPRPKPNPNPKAPGSASPPAVPSSAPSSSSGGRKTLDRRSCISIGSCDRVTLTAFNGSSTSSPTSSTTSRTTASSTKWETTTTRRSTSSSRAPRRSERLSP
mmetsp:Transcript_28301/g.90538  ORF Transcript_28301/g.90538 Transcript_28301/m.90538 type:complete len:341 (-) Transcript_28301:460-1482(-)